CVATSSSRIDAAKIIGVRIRLLHYYFSGGKLRKEVRSIDQSVGTPEMAPRVPAAREEINRSSGFLGAFTGSMERVTTPSDSKIDLGSSMGWLVERTK